MDSEVFPGSANGKSRNTCVRFVEDSRHSTTML
jgi:hypothetical protein